MPPQKSPAGFSPHELGKVPGNRQPKACSPMLTGGRAIGLLEGGEKFGLGFRVDSRAGVGNFKADQNRVCVLVHLFYFQGYAAVFGELDGIAGIVEQCLAQAGRVAEQMVRQGLCLQSEFEPLGLCAVLQHGDHVGSDGGHRYGGVFQREFSCLDLGKVENVVDDAQQMLACVADLVQAGGLLFGDAIALHQVGQPGNGVERRADFVAHVGEEGTLRPCCRFGDLLGLSQLAGAQADQFFKMEAVAVEFFGIPLLVGNVFLDGQVVGDLPIGLADGRENARLHVDLAVLPAVDELSRPVVSGGQRAPQLSIGFWRRLARLQDFRILPDQLFAGIAADLEQGRVYILDFSVGVCDDNAVRALLDRQRKLAQLHLALPPFGNVAQRRLEIGFAVDLHAADEDFRNEILAGVQAPVYPFEGMAAVFQGLLDEAIGQRMRGLSIELGVGG
jgi:hypothetical protein